MRLLIIGNSGGTHIGQSLVDAAVARAIDVSLVPIANAHRGNRLLRSACWRLLDHRPVRLNGFSRDVWDEVRRFKPEVLLTTGMAPVTGEALKALRGVKKLNYLTDDPWNPAQRSTWFFEALRHYDHVFTPRRANVTQLEGVCSGRVDYLPFAYDERLFFPEERPREEAGCQQHDVLFVGGADADRVPIISALARAGIDIALYGGYWERWESTRQLARGLVGPAELRKVTAAAKINLCLVRRANRDGHVMRSFEIGAVGACMLAEDTPEHRQLFGPDLANVSYFSSVPQLLERVRFLLDHPELRRRMAESVGKLIRNGANTYGDRLDAMLGRAVGGA